MDESDSGRPSPGDVFAALEASDPPSRTAVVAANLPIDVEATHDRLQELEREGRIRSDRIDGETLWWPSDDAPDFDALLEESVERVQNRLDREFRR